MALEDHVGDIVRKARLAREVSAGKAAAAAGLSAKGYEEFENSGRASAPLAVAELGRLLQLHPARLEEIAQGWEPPRVDVARWRGFCPITTDSGGFGVNSYLVWDEPTRDAALFDTGWDPVALFAEVERHRLLIRHVFITHTHQDHIACLGEVRARFPGAQLHSSSAHAPADQRNVAGRGVRLGTLEVTFRPTPGHADDGATYVIDHWPAGAPKVAVVGDALFAGSMGKAVGAAMAVALDAIQSAILSLPGETLLCPGHGPLSTVAEEKAHNPFLP